MEEASMSTADQPKTIGILAGGGPAPGINSVIHAVTIQAINEGFAVKGFQQGFQHLISGNPYVRDLTINDVSRIHRRGGIFLQTSRANPTRSEEDLRTTVQSLVGVGITHLVSIGGDDTASSAYAVSKKARAMGHDLRSVHVPKTIDNDLPLPEGIPTFGYETARQEGTRIVAHLMEDALTTVRWYIVVAMGRKAGHLAMGIGKSAGATLTLIPEEWHPRLTRLREVGDMISGSIVKRLAGGKGYGVALIAEGIIELMDKEDMVFLETVEKDEHGHPRLAEINSAAIIKREVRRTLQELGIRMTLVDKELGYELRCADTCAFDIDYTRSLGQAAVDFLVGGGTDAMITLQDNMTRVLPIPYDDMVDAASGRAGVRMVNVAGIAYQSARKFQIRLEREDLEDAACLQALAAQTNKTPDQFRARFGYLWALD
jgi:6-phosphofructokinase 1